MSSNSRRAALEDLLVDLFGISELRRWLVRGPDGTTLDGELPEHGPSPREFAHKAVATLIRRRLIDIEFFDRLCRDFSLREADINAVRASWAAARPPGEGPPQIVYANEEIQALGVQLVAAYKRKAMLTGSDSAVLDQEILVLRRQIRRGPQLHAGEILLGRYILASQLGTGGFATVWRAYDQELRRYVAVKVLHGQWSIGHDHFDRFRRGARIMQTLHHHAIVPILREVQKDDQGFVFFVMILLEGGSLQELLRARPGQIEVDFLLQTMVVICDAVAYAHEAGVIHRDIKPANILFDTQMRPYLADFDLVKAHDTTGGTVGGGMGTLLFSAPEMFVSAGDATPSVDVYSLGVTLLAALLGRDIRLDEIVKLPQLIDSLKVSAALKLLLTHATQWTVATRISSARHLKERIGAILEEQNSVGATIEVPLSQRVEDGAWCGFLSHSSFAIRHNVMVILDFYEDSKGDSLDDVHLHVYVGPGSYVGQVGAVAGTDSLYGYTKMGLRSIGLLIDTHGIRWSEIIRDGGLAVSFVTGLVPRVHQVRVVAFGNGTPAKSIGERFTGAAWRECPLTERASDGTWFAELQDDVFLGCANFFLFVESEASIQLTHILTGHATTLCIAPWTHIVELARAVGLGVPRSRALEPRDVAALPDHQICLILDHHHPVWHDIIGERRIAIHFHLPIRDLIRRVRLMGLRARSGWTPHDRRA